MIGVAIGIASGAVASGAMPDGSSAASPDATAFAALVEQAGSGDAAGAGRGGGEADPAAGEAEAAGLRATGLAVVLPGAALASISKARDQGRPPAVEVSWPSMAEGEAAGLGREALLPGLGPFAAGAEVPHTAAEPEGQEEPGTERVGSGPSQAAQPTLMVSHPTVPQPGPEAGPATPEEQATRAGPRSAPVVAHPHSSLPMLGPSVAGATAAPPVSAPRGRNENDDTARLGAAEAGFTLLRSETHLPPARPAPPFAPASRAGAMDHLAVATAGRTPAAMPDANGSTDAKAAGKEPSAVAALQAAPDTPALDASGSRTAAPPVSLADQLVSGILPGHARQGAWPGPADGSPVSAAPTVHPFEQLRSSVVRSIQFELHPGDMGSVVVRMSMRNDAVRLQLSFSAEKAAEQARADQGALAAALTMAGLPVDALAITTTQGAPQANGQPAANGQAADGRSQSPHSGAGRQQPQEGQPGERERRGSAGHDGRRGAGQGNEADGRLGLFV